MWWLAHGEHEVPRDNDWLSPRERSALGRIRYRKRYVEFLTRRWTAKCAVAAVLNRDATTAALAAIEIRNHASGAPFVAIDGCAAPVDISLSDRAGWAVCVVGAPDREQTLGIDLEIVEPRSDAFVADFFTTEERTALGAMPQGAARDEAANLIWSAKEAALKVLRVGLRADTRDVRVDIGRERRADGWSTLTVTSTDGRAFPGWWRRDGVFVLTVASSAPFETPSALPGGDLAAAVPVHSWLERPLI